MIYRENEGPRSLLSLWLEQKLGTRRWVVAFRLTARLRAQGYDRAVTRKRFVRLCEEFRQANGGEG